MGLSSAKLRVVAFYLLLLFNKKNEVVFIKDKIEVVFHLPNNLRSSTIFLTWTVPMINKYMDNLNGHNYKIILNNTQTIDSFPNKIYIIDTITQLQKYMYVL